MKFLFVLGYIGVAALAVIGLIVVIAIVFAVGEGAAKKLTEKK